MPYSIIIRSVPRTAQSPYIYAVPLWFCSLRRIRQQPLILLHWFLISPREQNVFALRDSAGFSSTPFPVVKVPFCIKVPVKLPSKQNLICYTKLRKFEPVHILLQLHFLCFSFDFVVVVFKLQSLP